PPPSDAFTAAVTASFGQTESKWPKIGRDVRSQSTGAKSVSAAPGQIASEVRHPFGTRRSVRIPEAADFLEVTTGTVKNLIRDGKIRSIKIGGSRRVLVDSLLEVAERGTN